jgi:hypothetical protein
VNVLTLLGQIATSIGIPTPSAYNSNAKLLQCLVDISEEMRSRRVFPQQKRTKTISLVAGDTSAAFPTDFYSGLVTTQFNQTNRWQLVGPLGDDEWNYRLYGPGGNSNRVHYRIFGPNIDQYSSAKMMKIDPAISANTTISYDYITRNLFYPTAWTPSETVYETVSADTDVPMFDTDLLKEGCIYLYRERRGLEFSELKQQFYKNLDRAAIRYMGQVKGSFAGEPVSERRYKPSTDGGWPA